MAEPSDNQQDGCGGCLIVIVIGMIVAAAMSLAALVDPFAWLPTVEELWRDCEGDQCDLADRFPGYWGHTAVNLVYDLAAMLAVGALAVDAREYRRNRTVRYNSAEDWERWRSGRSEMFWIGGLVVALATIPLVVAAA